MKMAFTGARCAAAIRCFDTALNDQNGLAVGPSRKDWPTRRVSGGSVSADLRRTGLDQLKQAGLDAAFLEVGEQALLPTFNRSCAPRVPRAVSQCRLRRRMHQD